MVVPSAFVAAAAPVPPLPLCLRWVHHHEPFEGPPEFWGPLRQRRLFGPQRIPWGRSEPLAP
eukprot:11226495-Lingulodinium_polyedra.AAC.1